MRWPSGRTLTSARRVQNRQRTYLCFPGPMTATPDVRPKLCAHSPAVPPYRGPSGFLLLPGPRWPHAIHIGDRPLRRRSPFAFSETVRRLLGNLTGRRCPPRPGRGHPYLSRIAARRRVIPRGYYPTAIENKVHAGAPTQGGPQALATRRVSPDRRLPTADQLSTLKEQLQTAPRLIIEQSAICQLP
jgi:hypothetical protein